MATRLEFLENEAGEVEGLGDAGIEIFRDAPYASCAREAGQNSRDAEKSLPVRLTFNVRALASEEFPCLDALRTTLRQCLSASVQEKEREFFQNAIRLSDSTPISVLEIADFNTKGLTGPPDEPRTPFHSLLKGSGVSTKESETAGGSFGIGKNASMAVSDLQMVIYSTIYDDPTTGIPVHAAQGKVKLVTHRDQTGQLRRAVGYWGAEGYAAISDPDQVPAWMRRTERGTSIYCMGFRNSPDWAAHMTASVVTNFFAAVLREEMVFEIDSGRFQINKNTIEGLLANPAVLDAAERSGHIADLEFASQLYSCLVSPNAVEESFELGVLGRLRVRILVAEGMPRRIGFVRNGMYITDNLKNFGHTFTRFPGSRDFIALVEPADPAASKLLKQLENPRHDEFSAQRISDPRKRTEAEAAMRSFGKKLRDVVRTATKVEASQSVVLDELSRYFADTTSRDDRLSPTGEPNPEKLTFTPPVVRKRTSAPTTPGAGQEGGRPGTGHGGGSNGNRGGGGQVPGAGSGTRTGRKRRTAIRLTGARCIPKKQGPESARILFLSSDESALAHVAILATGLENPDELTIVSATTGEVHSGKLEILLAPGRREKIEITLAEDYSGPVEIVAWEPEPEGLS